MTLEVRGIGDNHPPEPTPYEIAEKTVNDVCSETAMWLDGATIDSKELADGVANLLVMIRKAAAQAEEARKAEKEPLDKAIKEIQDRFNLLIGDTKTVKGKTVLAAAACQAALEPWLKAEDARLKEDARIAREEAERQRAEAEKALRASDARNLAEREAAEALLRQAKLAETVANVAGRQTATAGGAFGRATGLRTSWVVTIDDPAAAARACWTEARPEMLVFLQGWAERRAREGARVISGFIIEEKKVAV